MRYRSRPHLDQHRPNLVRFGGRPTEMPPNLGHLGRRTENHFGTLIQQRRVFWLQRARIRMPRSPPSPRLRLGQPRAAASHLAQQRARAGGRT